ncbi:c-type cytochrome [Bradyrhizobium sp. WSM 1704]|uniref:cytochrome-c peroxidase n=1 Tax=Bradyrhizobium semiaridum TaxID=2821404 RepID=UPI001CE26078|nr:cytochrome c peroxidase [Bradyrhizobium semiaridum]MCA6124937.1 c-type cytochrome [Bradyrhizobium semiaridum]
MRLWVSLTLLAAFLPVGLSFALNTAKAPDDAATVRASYRRPAAVPFPKSNPHSEAKSVLGAMLFFDPLLSRSKTLSCSSCHNPSLSWADGLPRAIGEDPNGLPIRAPTLIDVAFFEPLGWDGKFSDLESVAFGPILSPANMNMTEPELIARLAAIPGYVDAFSKAFGDGAITRPRIEASLATFERSIVAAESPFDRWINGDESAISASAQHGFQLFNGKARCAACHSGPSFSDGSFQDIGTARGNDVGRGRFFPKSTKLRYAFKTPTLRDVARRAPYMHDGSVATLEEVIELYNKGGIDRPSRSPDIKPLALTAAEKHDLIAFLQTLTATPPPFAVPALPR